jgi:glycosyltransferase involved in cell wall biosynthesis
LAPSLSVIIPTCNRAGWLPAAVRSALQQTVDALEVLVVDDGSTDGTQEVCRGLAAADERVRFCRQENAGLAAARNAGLAQAGGEWVAFLDDDDLLRQDALSRLVETAAAAAAPAAVGWASTYESNRPDLTADQVFEAAEEFRLQAWGAGVPRGVLQVEELVLQPMVPINAAVFGAAGLRALGGFRAELREVEDYDLWLRLSADAGIPVVHERLALVRRHPDQMSGSLKRMAAATRRVLEEFLAGRPDVAARVPRRALRHRLAHLGREEAYAALLAGDSSEAARASWYSIRRRPLQWKSWFYLGFSPMPGAYRALRARKA